MTEPDVTAVAPLTRADRWPRIVALSGAGLAGIGCVLMYLGIKYQKPCLNGGVHFLDLSVPVLVVLAILLVAEVAVALAVRGTRPHYATGTLAVLLTFGVLFFLPFAISFAWEALFTDGSATCWTF